MEENAMGRPTAKVLETQLQNSLTSKMTNAANSQFQGEMSFRLLLKVNLAEKRLYNTGNST
jgi:hypothetical protein